MTEEVILPKLDGLFALRKGGVWRHFQLALARVLTNIKAHQGSDEGEVLGLALQLWPTAPKKK